MLFLLLFNTMISKININNNIINIYLLLVIYVVNSEKYMPIFKFRVLQLQNSKKYSKH